MPAIFVRLCLCGTQPKALFILSRFTVFKINARINKNLSINYQFAICNILYWKLEFEN